MTERIPAGIPSTVIDSTALSESGSASAVGLITVPATPVARNVPVMLAKLQGVRPGSFERALRMPLSSTIGARGRVRIPKTATKRSIEALISESPVAGPAVAVTRAMPDASVTALAALRMALPSATVNCTGTPGTMAPPLSRTSTANGSANSALVSAD